MKESYWQKRGDDGAGGNDAMDSTDDRRNDAIRAGKKRSVTDRLGHRHRHRNADESGRPDVDDQLDDLSIPPPGVSRNIPGD